MKISEAAAASGCHFETIRYYERIGLLPKCVRSANRYRDYTRKDVDRMRFVTRGRELGFSLDEIRSLLRLAADSTLSCAEADQVARRHLVEVRARIAELRRMAKELERTIESCAGGSSATCSILGALKETPRQRRSAIDRKGLKLG
jgi:MerR family transcriptional regulator, mercuric resistance operon regulatory protein